MTLVSFALIVVEAVTFLPALAYGLWSTNHRKRSLQNTIGQLGRAHGLEAQQNEYWILTSLVLGGWIITAILSAYLQFVSYADLGLLLSILLLFLGSWYPLVFARTFVPLLEKDQIRAALEPKTTPAEGAAEILTPMHLGERKAAHWAEAVSFSGVIVAILGTLATAASNYSSEIHRDTTDKCVGTISRVIQNGPDGLNRRNEYEKALREISINCTINEIASRS